jgi:hypothetical protein
MVAFTNPVKDVVASGRESGLSTGSACRKESAETFPTAGNSPSQSLSSARYSRPICLSSRRRLYNALTSLVTYGVSSALSRRFADYTVK